MTKGLNIRRDLLMRTQPTPSQTYTFLTDDYLKVYSEPEERARKARETRERYDFTCLTVEEVARSYQVIDCVLALCVWWAWRWWMVDLCPS